MTVNFGPFLLQAAGSVDVWRPAAIGGLLAFVGLVLLALAEVWFWGQTT